VIFSLGTSNFKYFILSDDSYMNFRLTKHYHFWTQRQLVQFNLPQKILSCYKWLDPVTTTVT